MEELKTRSRGNSIPSWCSKDTLSLLNCRDDLTLDRTTSAATFYGSFEYICPDNTLQSIRVE